MRQGFMTDDERNAPFSYMHNRVLILLNRCDMGGLNYIVADPEVTDGQIAQAIVCFTGHWMLHVHPHLNGFSGLDVYDWTVIRERCDHESIVDDHMSGDLTCSLEYPDGYADGGSASGFENVNLVDRHVIYPDDPRHPHYDVAKAITDELNVVSGPHDVEYGVETVESVFPDGKAEIIGGGERDAYRATICYHNGQRRVIRAIMASSGTCLADYEVVEELPSSYELAKESLK